MARIINTNSPGKRRGAHMRTIAEILRRLSQQQDINEETRDLAAALVYCLRGIDMTVEESMRAWEKRGYWKKSDDFQQKWWWASLMAKSLAELIKADNWEKLPDAMISLFPHVAHIQVNRMTRGPEAWQDAYKRLMQERQE